MPILNGFEATRAIRAVEAERHRQTRSNSISSASSSSTESSNGPSHRAKIIALTGLAAEDDKKRAFSAGVDGFLTKPVSLKTLAAVVRSECSSSGPHCSLCVDKACALARNVLTSSLFSCLQSMGSSLVLLFKSIPSIVTSFSPPALSPSFSLILSLVPCSLPLPPSIHTHLHALLHTRASDRLFFFAFIPYLIVFYSTILSWLSLGFASLHLFPLTKLAFIFFHRVCLSSLSVPELSERVPCQFALCVVE